MARMPVHLHGSAQPGQVGGLRQSYSVYLRLKGLAAVKDSCLSLLGRLNGIGSGGVSAAGKRRKTPSPVPVYYD